MSQEPITISYNLEEVLKEMTLQINTGLEKIEQKMDKQYTELNQKMDRQYGELNQKMDKQYTELHQKMDKQYTELHQKMDKQYEETGKKFDKLDGKIDKIEKDVNDLKVGQATLSAEVKGLTKRIDFQEFINRGVVIGLMATILGGAAKMLGWIGN